MDLTDFFPLVFAGEKEISYLKVYLSGQIASAKGALSFSLTDMQSGTRAEILREETKFADDDPRVFLTLNLGYIFFKFIYLFLAALGLCCCV